MDKLEKHCLPVVTWLAFLCLAIPAVMVAIDQGHAWFLLFVFFVAACACLAYAYSDENILYVAPIFGLMGLIFAEAGHRNGSSMFVALYLVMGVCLGLACAAGGSRQCGMVSGGLLPVLFVIASRHDVGGLNAELFAPLLIVSLWLMRLVWSKTEKEELVRNDPMLRKGVERAVLMRDRRKLVEKYAKRGDDWAQYELGSIHEHGLGLYENHREALKWYRLAAEQGHAEARLKLASMLEKANVKGLVASTKPQG